MASCGKYWSNAKDSLTSDTIVSKPLWKHGRYVRALYTNRQCLDQTFLILQGKNHSEIQKYVPYHWDPANYIIIRKGGRHTNVSLSDCNKEENIWRQICLVCALTVHCADDLEQALAIPDQLLTCIQKPKAFSGLRKFICHKISSWYTGMGRLLAICEPHESQLAHAQ